MRRTLDGRIKQTWPRRASPGEQDKIITDLPNSLIGEALAGMPQDDEQAIGLFDIAAGVLVAAINIWATFDIMLRAPRTLRGFDVNAWTIGTYCGAALAEIAGCFAFWAWLREGRSGWWIIPGVAALILFAWLLTLIPTAAAGRAYAAYGGIYIVASLAWMWIVEKSRPDTWDTIGAAICITGAAVILLAPRSA